MVGLSQYGHAYALWSALDARGAAVQIAEDAAGAPEVAIVGIEPPAELLAALRAFLGSELGREHQPPFRAMAAVVRAPGRAAREVLTLPVQFLGSYPIAYTVRCSTRGARAQGWAWTTSKGSFENLVQARTPAFLVRELDAVGLGVEMGRVRPPDFAAWLGQKAGKDFRITPQLARVAEMPAYRDGMKPSLCVGELLDALDCEIAAVELHEPKGA